MYFSPGGLLFFFSLRTTRTTIKIDHNIPKAKTARVSGSCLGTRTRLRSTLGTPCMCRKKQMTFGAKVRTVGGGGGGGKGGGGQQQKKMQNHRGKGKM